jgi:hypothetical protein
MTDSCGSVMYGRTSGKRALYTCRRYMRTAGAECENNQIDAEALNRLVLSCLRQCAASGMQRSRLTELLKKRAAESAAGRSDVRPFGKFAAAVKGKVRKIRRLVGGLIVFGDRELPVLLHGRDRLDPEGTPPQSRHGHDSGAVNEKAKKSSRREMSGADPGGSAPTSIKRNESHREGVSSTKVSRGDRI